MKSTQTQMSMNMVLVLAGAVGFVAFLILMVLGGYGFPAAFFLGILVAAVVFVILLLGFRSKPDQPTQGSALGGSGSAGGGSSAGTAAAASGGSGGVSASASGAAASSAAPVSPPASAAAKAASKPAAPKPAAGTASGADYDGDGTVEGTSEGTKPPTLSAARGGKADDLKKIKGVGPKMEQLCNKLGFYHFDQIAGWTPDEVAWVDANLEGFKGRVSRDTWVEQAKLLASGGQTEFSKKVDKGGVY